jgi:hypothetical protein
MWCFINHTKQHIVRAELYDIGRQLNHLIRFSDWTLTHDIDVEDIEIKSGKYKNYTFDL